MTANDSNCLRLQSQAVWLAFEGEYYSKKGFLWFFLGFTPFLISFMSTAPKDRE
jgi:hypothetical protein